MMPLTGSGWLEAVPVVLVAVLVVFVPGAVAARLMGLRGLASLALGPGLSVSAIVVVGALLPMVHVRWGPLTLLATVVALWLGSAVVRRMRPGSAPAPDGPLGPTLVAAALAFVAVALVLVPVSGSPEAFPQDPDTIFHLGAAQWMQARGDISTLHAAGFSRSSGTGFYPAGFHAVVVTVAQLTHAPIVVSASSVALVTAGLIWPLGCIFLARTVFGPSRTVTYAAAFGSVAFSAFPFWLMGYGVLWANLLGQALLPLSVACLVMAVRPVEPPERPRSSTWARRLGYDSRPHPLLPRGTALLLLLCLFPGLAVSHPNAVFALALIGYCILVEAVLTSRPGRKRHRLLPVAALAVGTALGAAVWAVATRASVAMRHSNPPGPEASVREALVSVVSFSPRGLPHLWVAGVLVLVGAVVIAVAGRAQRWIVGSLGACVALYLLLVVVDSAGTRLLTWPWYNNSPRLASLMVLPAVLALTAALRWSSTAVARVVPARPAFAAAGALALVVLVTGGGYVGAHQTALRPFFHPTPERTWASPADLRALRALSHDVTGRSVVAANPWNGGTYMYVVSGRRLLFPTEKSIDSPDRALLARSLDEAGRSARVCAAARRQHVRYAMTGGTLFAGMGPGYRRYPGVDGVGSSRAFRHVATAGDFRLYKLVSCRGRALA